MVIDIDPNELEGQLLEREMKMDHMHDEAILNGKCCLNCRNCLIERLPNNWWNDTFYCKTRKIKTVKYGVCEGWCKKDDNH